MTVDCLECTSTTGRVYSGLVNRWMSRSENCSPQSQTVRITMFSCTQNQKHMLVAGKHTINAIWGRYILHGDRTIVLRIKEECVEYGHERRVPHAGQIRFGELECTRKLLQQLPHAIQIQQKQWTLLARTIVDDVAQAIARKKKLFNEKCEYNIDRVYLNGWPSATHSFCTNDWKPAIVRLAGSSSNWTRLDSTQHMSRPSHSCSTTVTPDCMRNADSVACLRHSDTYSIQQDFSRRL